MKKETQSLDNLILYLSNKKDSDEISKEELLTLACLLAIKGSIQKCCLEDFAKYIGNYSRAMLIKSGETSVFPNPFDIELDVNIKPDTGDNNVEKKQSKS